MGEKGIEELIKQIFEERKRIKGLTNVQLKIIKSRFKSNSFTTFDHSLNSSTVIINVSGFDEISDVEKLKLCLYNSIEHELSHASILEKGKNNNCYDWSVFITLLEYINYVPSILFDKDGRLLFCNFRQFNKKMKFNYESSISEISSNLDGFSLELGMIESNNSVVLKSCQSIVLSLKFLQQNLEIGYGDEETYYDTGITYLKSGETFLKKHPIIVNKFQMLQNVFNLDGSLKDVYSLYLSINDENRELIDKVLLNLIIIKEDELSKVNDSGFISYLSELLDRYQNDCIEYIKNLRLGFVFLENEKILINNLKIKKAKINKLKDILERLSDFRKKTKV